MKAGFLFAYYSRLASPVMYIIIMLVALMMPIIAIIIFYSLQGGNSLIPFYKPSFSIFQCPIEPCTNIVYGAAHNATAIDNIERVIDVLSNNYKKSFSSLKVDDMSQMKYYFAGEYRGKAGIGIFYEAHELYLYSREKENGRIISDSKMAKSGLLYVKALLEEYDLEDYKYYYTSLFSTISMTPTIILISFYFMFISFVTLQSISMLKDKRRYEYLVCNGLRRTRFWIGMMLFVAAEVAICLLVMVIILTAAKFLSADPIKSLFLPLFGIFAILASNVAFLWFVASFTNTTYSLMLSFTLIYMLGYVVVYLLQVFVPFRISDYINMVLQILLPFTNTVRYFSQLAMLFSFDNMLSLSGEEPLGFWQFLTSTEYSTVPLWVNIVTSIASSALAIFLAILIETTNKFANYPTRRSLKAIKISPEQRALYSKDFYLRTEGLTVRFKTRQMVTTAIDDLDLDFKSGRATIGLIAENGAGKTTLFRAALGAVRPAQGKVFVNGLQAIECDHDFYKYIAVVFQENILFTGFTVQMHMNFMAKVLGEDLSRIPMCLDQMGLLAETSKRVQKLSGGMQRRLNISVALLKSNPQLYMFDEPACGVDIESRKFLWNFLKNLQVMTFITTHAMEEVEEICDKVIMLKKGKLVIQGDLIEVKRYLCTGYKIKSKNANPFPQLVTPTDYQFSGIIHKGAEIVIPYSMEDKISEILRRLNNECIVRSPSLTEAFLNVYDGTYESDILT